MRTSDRRSRLNFQRGPDGNEAGQGTDGDDDQKGNEGIEGEEFHPFREQWGNQRGGRLADDKPNDAQPPGLLQNHGDDGGIVGADQFENGDFADFSHGHVINDESNDGGADDGQNDHEHAELPQSVGDDPDLQDLPHLLVAVDFEVFPAFDGFRNGGRIIAGRHPDQHGVDLLVGLLRLGDGLQQPGRTGTVQFGIGA